MPEMTPSKLNALSQFLESIAPNLGLSLSEQINLDAQLDQLELESVPIQSLLATETNVLSTTFSLNLPTTVESLFLITEETARQLTDILEGNEQGTTTEALTSAQTTKLSNVMAAFTRGLAGTLASLLNDTTEVETCTTHMGALTLPPVFALDGQALQATFRLQLSDVVETSLTFLLVPELAEAWIGANGYDLSEGANANSDLLSEDMLAAMLDDIGGSLDESPAGSAPSASAAAAPFPNFPGQTEGTLPRGMELILDIPLDVTVELGRVRMLIKDVLELASGSIVELDRVAGEPVDLLVNGRLIAKGEVVVIEDNFGIRITEIISPADRVSGLGKAR